MKVSVQRNWTELRQQNQILPTVTRLLRHELGQRRGLHQLRSVYSWTGQSGVDVAEAIVGVLAHG